MESWLIALYAQIETIKAEIEGMKAANQYRINRNETIAYNEKAFQEKAIILWDISNLILKNRIEF